VRGTKRNKRQIIVFASLCCLTATVDHQDEQDDDDDDGGDGDGMGMVMMGCPHPYAFVVRV